MNRQWLVTGANGYLGGELCDGMRRAGHTVCGFVRSGRSSEIRQAKGVRCETYEALPEILSAGDVLVHCAGKVCATGNWADYERTNVDWSVSLYDSAASRGAACFIYVSSIAAVGYSNRNGESSLTEDAEPRLLPGELYGRSKWQAEQALLARSQDQTTRLVILRPGLVYGRRTLAGPTGWLRRGQVVDPGQRVPLVHVDSVLDAVLLTADNPDAEGVFFVVDDEQPTLRELNATKIQLGLLKRKPWPVGKLGYRAICAIRGLARRARGLGGPPKGYFEAQYALQTRRLLYSTEKLRRTVDWSPAVSLRMGLEQCATLDHKDAWEHE